MRARQVTVEEAEMLQQLGVPVYCSDTSFSELGHRSMNRAAIEGQYWGIVPMSIPFQEWQTRVVLEE